jgi:hypothetical protein
MSPSIGAVNYARSIDQGGCVHNFVNLVWQSVGRLHLVLWFGNLLVDFIWYCARVCLLQRARACACVCVCVFVRVCVAFLADRVQMICVCVREKNLVRTGRKVLLCDPVADD